MICERVALTCEAIEYRLEQLASRGIPTIAGLTPAKHATRNGWMARAAHIPRDPFAERVDARVWETSDGRSVSLRELALDVATHFRDSIHRVAESRGTGAGSTPR